MSKIKIVLLVLGLLVVVGGVGTFMHFKNKFLAAPPNELTLSGTGTPFGFDWEGLEIGGEYDPQSAIFVPVTIPGVDYTFYMQFDTGAPSTVLYYRNVMSINEQFGDVFKVVQEDSRAWVEDAELNVGSVNLKATKLDFRGMGNSIDWSDPPEVIKIGTVGSDFMEHHVLSIDYANAQITLSDPGSADDIAEEAFLPFTFEGRKVFLSAMLDDEDVSLWFDSGSSAFELIVDEDAFEELATPGAERETFVINSWGTGVTAHNIAASGEFRFGTVSVPLTYVTHFEWPNKLQALILKMSNIGGDLGGMTGNKLFLGKTLVLDTPNLRYAVIPE